MNKIKQIEMMSVTNLKDITFVNDMISDGWSLLMVYKNGEVLLGATEEVSKKYPEFVKSHRD